MSTDIQYFYISTGDKRGFYTLRGIEIIRTYVQNEWGNGMVSGSYPRDFYVQNLSTDYDTAVEKAKDMIGDTPLKTEAFALEEIKRRDAELVEAEKRAIIQAAQEEYDRIVGSGGLFIMPFGKWSGRPISEIPLDYRVWFVNSLDGEADSKTRAIAAVMNWDGSVTAELERRERRQKEIEERKANSQFVGEIGERQDFILKHVYSRSFGGYYGTVFIEIFTDMDGNTIKYMGGASLDVEPDGEYTITGTIKKHEEYQGEKQTVIARPKVKEG